jgi:hydroxymethylglutaryl-CoA synthase
MSERPVPIGLDHIALHTPARFMAMEDLAAARGIDPQKYLTGIGIREMALAETWEDVVVLAAEAGRKVLEQAGVSADSIGLLIVGTESAEDKSKPTATHVHELLGISSRCRVFDVVHACAGASYGVLAALDWIAARPDEDRKALVIASDIARYGRGTLGEPTQGAGAAAMLISRNPRLMTLREVATYSRSVHDFWKPLASEYPIVNGMYSTQCYTDALAACLEQTKISADAYCVYHTPYPKLVQQAHLRTARAISRDIDTKAHFAERVAPSLVYPSRVGNIYTGSLWMALASLLESTAAQAKPNDDYFLFTYGSGSGAAFLHGVAQDGAAEMIGRLNVGAMLDARSKVDVSVYERLADAYERRSAPTDGEGPGFRFTGIRDDKRLYARNGEILTKG